MSTIVTHKYLMLFNKFFEAVKKYPVSPAINDLTYNQIFENVLSRSYKPVSESTGMEVVLDILKAASINKPIVILPKFKRNDVIIPEMKDEFGIYLYSSGSTGQRKSIFISETMILSNAVNAISSQNIKCNDKIFTVCSLNHTGGLNAQTLPGLLTGAHTIIEDFNAFNFFRKLEEYNVTMTHLIPLHIDALIKVSNQRQIKTLKLVVAGSDCVKKEHVEFWNNLETNFMCNYGMTEAGPIILNHRFKPGSDLSVYDHGVVLGNKFWCDYKIENGELFLKGSCVNTEDWLATGDCVVENNGWIYYLGRKSAGCKIIPKQY